MPTGHQPGDPIKQGKYCWVNTNSHGNGWWDQLRQQRSANPRARSQRGVTEIDLSGGDGAGGGSGGSGR